MRGRNKERSRIRGHSKERSRTKGRSKEKSRMRGCSKERRRTRRHSKERRRMRGHSKKRSKTQGRSKERRRMRGHSKKRSKTQGRSKNRSRTRERSKERSRTEDLFRLVLSPELRQEYKIVCHHPLNLLISGEEKLQPKKNSKKKSKISKNSDDEDDEEELQPKKNSKKKSKISRNSDDRNNDEEFQLKKDDGKKKSKKSKNSDDKDDKKEFQLKKDDVPRRVTYHHLVDLLKDMKENLRIIRSKMKYQTNASKQPTQYQYNFQIAKGYDDLIISKLKKSEPNPIVMKNMYHSTEESEVDPDGDSNKTYKRRQKRVFDNSRYASGEDIAPLNAAQTVENYKDNVNDPVNTKYYSSRKKSRSTEEAEDAE
ncbi:hypothetical protein RCL_jg3068.t1 [Rhizophagus clarus]|uniref:Uncharacterized protein n=1 Tax=Rhizophagus clarus TaxID=94130 RepID=A0A8H3M3N6_9GLOM|nr:hypothetical protein RCL_jg3068.t1 [Rhizophagus clarus]